MLIQAMSAMRYTAMMNRSQTAMINAGNARMGLLSQVGNPSFGSLDSLAAMDTQYELDAITNSVQYQMAKAMLEQIKRMQKEDSKNLSLWA